MRAWLCLEEAVERGEKAVVVVDVLSACVCMQGARELSSEGAEGREGRRQFAWRLRVLLGLEAGTGHCEWQNWAEGNWLAGWLVGWLAGRARGRGRGREEGKEVRVGS